MIFYHFNCSERLLKSHHVFLVPVVAACSQLLLKSVSKRFENVEWSNSLLRHFKIQTLLKINSSMAALSAFGVTQHSQIFSLFFRNRIQYIALYQLHSSQALLNLRLGYYTFREKKDYLYNFKSEVSNVCDVVEGHFLQAIKIVHHHANGCFDWLVSGQQSVNPSREAISILSGKYKSFTFVHPVTRDKIQ